MRPASLNLTPRGWLYAFSFAVAFACMGCGGKDGSQGSNDSIYGKVTYNGQVVAGQVIFIGSDKKEIMSMIGGMDGSYEIKNPPKGEGVFLVKATMAPPLAPLKGGAQAPKGGAQAPEAPSMGGVAPPAKYGQPSTSDLKFTVTGGKQNYDITLQ